LNSSGNSSDSGEEVTSTKPMVKAKEVSRDIFLEEESITFEVNGREITGNNEMTI